MYEIAAIPIEEQREEDPEFTIDPMFSGTHADGGKHREERHRDLEASPAPLSEKAAWSEEEAL